MQAHLWHEERPRNERETRHELFDGCVAATAGTFQGQLVEEDGGVEQDEGNRHCRGDAGGQVVPQRNHGASMEVAFWAGNAR